VIPEICKPGMDVSREGQTIIDGATAAALFVRMAMSSVHISDPERVPTLLESREAFDQEERSEHEAKRDRDRATVLLHSCPQGPQHGRDTSLYGCVEADECKNRYGEDEERQPERHGAA
jgi:hypothetical protein